MKFLFELIADIVFEAAADQILDKKQTIKVKIICALIVLIPMLLLIGGTLYFAYKNISTDIPVSILLFASAIFLMAFTIYAIVINLKKFK